MCKEPCTYIFNFYKMYNLFIFLMDIKLLQFLWDFRLKWNIFRMLLAPFQTAFSFWGITDNVISHSLYYSNNTFNYTYVKLNKTRINFK